ncbi:MAG: lactate racemase domain-containing protein [Bacteroidales bacterium]|nr:lactate racemase domain-containing protein [Bacteroidales bacterium]
MIYYARGSATEVITREEVDQVLHMVFDKMGTRERVLALPPDFTRYHSQAGMITELCYQYYGKALTDVMPALGTHEPMSDAEISGMFGSVPRNLFRVHDWRNEVVTVGKVPPEVVYELSEGKLDYAWPAQVNYRLLDPSYDLILSIGQVVPHEVIGMANYNKNIFVGAGGAEGINKSHYLGAIYGLERIMGRTYTPVRRMLEYASEHFIAELPILYIQTVLSRDESGKLVLRGLYIGDDYQCFELASALALEVNFNLLDRTINRCVVWLDPSEYKSTWLGNKAVYRSRLAMADRGELLILAPGLKRFGEDAEIDRLIRKYGYGGTPAVLEATARNKELQDNLSTPSHLIHGSSEGRFTIRYCPGHLTRQEIEGVKYQYGELKEYMEKYNPERLKEGWNQVDGEEIFFISNPALGLWAHKSRFVQ